MTLRGYIEEMSPIDRLVERYTSDPLTRIMEADNLPYDKICMFEGKLQKVVEISEDEVVPVFELLSLDERDLQGYPAEFVEIYHTYMENIELTDMNVTEIINISRNYRKLKKQKEERIS